MSKKIQPNQNLIKPERNVDDYYLNKQATVFRGFGRSGTSNGIPLDIEDPTYLVFDLNVYNVSNNPNDSHISPFFDSSDAIRKDSNGLNFYNIYATKPKERGKGIINFYNNYAELDDEIKSAGYAYAEFIKIFNIIFPGVLTKDDNDNGTKRHYINSISGLDVLNKKILDFPNDKLTITLSEDVTMLVQYLSELYLDLSYSYASNRQLVPSNLLRFDMYLTISDLRDMKMYGIPKSDLRKKDLLSAETNKASIGLNKLAGIKKDINKENIIENKSKLIYVLHDCELDFSNSKIHGAEIITGGFNTGPSTTPATMNIDIIFKSYSRILSPALMETSGKKSFILDYRLKGSSLLQNLDSRKSTAPIQNSYNYKEFYDKFNHDYRTQEQYDDMLNKYPVSLREQPIALNKNAAKKKSAIGSALNKLVNDQKNNLINGTKNQLNKLEENLQKGISDMIGINLAFTKFNVYYETPAEKIDKLSMLATSLFNKTANSAQAIIGNSLKEVNRSLKTGESLDIKNLNIDSNFNSVLGKDALLGDLSNLIGGRKTNPLLTTDDGIEGRYNNESTNPSIKSVLDKDNVFNNDHKVTINEKYPEGDRQATGKYNKKKPTDKITNETIKKLENGDKPIGDSGDLHPNGKYNKKYPIGEGSDRQATGKYNKKKPTDKIINETIKKLEKGDKPIGDSGDLQADGKYNKKYPIGDGSDRQATGKYNKKTPIGDGSDRQAPGVYNKKTPVGDGSDRQADGKYNEKYPEGDLHETGKYNEKYPEGDLHKTGVYNEKYPEGDLHENGIYNEKYPEGDLHETAKYNEKYPSGDLHETAKYNEKYPSGDLHETAKYNEKFPSGDLHETAKYNEKFPESIVREDKGKYNKKYPSGDLHENGKYNEKYPSGDLHETAKYNEKYPNDVVREVKGKYNEKYPDGSLHTNGQYNIKFPDDDVRGEKGKYNEKYPDGDLHTNGQYNIKFPEDDVREERGTYNEKYPEGDLHNDGKYNNKKPSDINIYGEGGKYNKKYPEGDKEETGIYNEKYPDDKNIYLKNRLNYD